MSTMQQRTPTKIRSRREHFRLDEIPTKDTSPSFNPPKKEGESSNFAYHQKPRQNSRRTMSLDFTRNSISPNHQRHSENNDDISKSHERNKAFTQELKEFLTCENTSSASSEENVDEEEVDEDEEEDNQEDIDEPHEDSEAITDVTDEPSLGNAGCNFNHENVSNQDTFSSELRSNSSIQSLSRGIYNIWRNQQLCDTVFVVNGDSQRFHAHKLVLATTCDLFAAESNDTRMTVFRLSTVQGKTMKQALKFFYTGKIDVTPDNVEDMLEISRKVHSKKLSDKCKDCLLQVNTAIAILNRALAFKYGLYDVVASIDSYIQDHLSSMINNDSFLKSDFQIIYNIISSDMMTKTDELQIFHACASWINYDPDKRSKYAVPLMSMVRFDHITLANIVSQVESVAFMINTPECKDMLYQVFRQHALFRNLVDSVSQQITRAQMSGRSAPRSTPCYRSPGSTPSNSHLADSHESDVFSKENGHYENNTQQDAKENFKDASKAHEKYTNKREINNDASNIVQTLQIIKRHNQLSKDCKQDTSGKSSESFASKDSGKQNRHISSTAQVERFASDGRRVLPMQIMDGIHFFKKPSTAKIDSWDSLPSSSSQDNGTFEVQRVESLSADRKAPATQTCYQTELSPILAGSSPFNCQNESAPSRPPLILAMGGINPYNKTNDVQQLNMTQSIHGYNPKDNYWSVVTEMPQPLHHFAVTSLFDKIYIIGGQKTCSNNEEQPSRDCFQYDVTLGKWKTIALLKTARALHVAVTVNDTVYVIGGIDCVEMSLKSTEYYEQDEDKWFFTQPMKDARVELAAVAHRGKIMVVGGILDVDEKFLLDSVEVYEPHTGNWTSKSRFPLHIAGGSMVEVNGAVFFVGGYVSQDKTCLSVDSVFRYCDETDSWNGYQTLRVPRHKALVSVIGCRIYVIGGESSASLGHALTNVECIDIQTNDHVTGIAPLMSPAYGIGGCALT